MILQGDLISNPYLISILLIILLVILPFYFYNRPFLGSICWLLGFLLSFVYLLFHYSFPVIFLIFFGILAGIFIIFYNYELRIPKLVHDLGVINVIQSISDILKFKIPNKKIIDENKKSDLNCVHVGIIIAKKRGYFREMDENVYADGIDLITEFLLRKNIQFNIYECDSPHSAEDIISNPNINGLIIFGHGSKCSLSFGLNGYLDYCEVRNAPKKRIIAQLHCNSSEKCKCSLADYLLDPDGKKLISDGYRCVHQNRIDLENFLLANGNELEILLRYS